MCCPRGNVDDRASRSSVACRHAPHGLTRTKHRSGDVDGECFFDRLCRQVLHPREAASHTCIVYESLDGSQFAFCGLEEREDLIFARNIGLDGDRMSASGDNFLCQLLRLGLGTAEI
jgi:hypothetical protein